jgi:hypothetical protein
MIPENLHQAVLSQSGVHILVTSIQILVSKNKLQNCRFVLLLTISSTGWGIPFKEGQTGTIPKIFDPVCGKDDDTEYENSPSPPPGPLAQERAPRVIDSFRKRMQ